MVSSKYLFRSTNGTGQIDDEREKEAMKKLNVVVETERRKQDEAMDAARRRSRGSKTRQNIG